MQSGHGENAVPRHVAIIMDGNGRWAAARGLPRSAGHRQGVEALRQAVRTAADLGIEYLTIYSFSSENWSRPAAEVSFLLDLLRRFIPVFSIHSSLECTDSVVAQTAVVRKRDYGSKATIWLILQARTQYKHNTGFFRSLYE